MIVRLRTTSLLILLALSPCASRAQDALENGSFDTEVPPWFDFSGGTNGTVEWGPFDVDARPDSGSLLVTNTSTNLGETGEGVTQLAPIAGGRPFLLRIHTYVPAGGPSVAYATAELQFWRSLQAGCEGSLFNLTVQHFGNTSNALDSWETRSVVSIAPAAATCALVHLETYRETAQTDLPFRAYFDEIELLAMLFVDDFESGSLQAWTTSP